MRKKKSTPVLIAKSPANEFGEHGITVNCIASSVILTHSWDKDAKNANMNRKEYALQFCKNVISKELLGMPEDVVKLVCYLCSDLARWITGSNFRVDGGSLKNIQI